MDAIVTQNNDWDWGIKEMEKQVLKSSVNKRERWVWVKSL